MIPKRHTCHRCAAKVFHDYAVSSDGVLLCASCTRSVAGLPSCRWCLRPIAQTDGQWAHEDGKRRSHTAELREY
jgi:hypothetical protein